jgi:hypothetical protein
MLVTVLLVNKNITKSQTSKQQDMLLFLHRPTIQGCCDVLHIIEYSINDSSQQDVSQKVTGFERTTLYM